MNSKVLVWSYLMVLSFATIISLYIPKSEAVAKESIVIPGDAIRLRILANSDTEEDQAIKRKVRDAVNAQITLWVQDLTSKEKAKEVLKSNLPELQKIAENVVAEQGSAQSVDVDFGKVQFPTKLYGQFLYPAGEYEAILITLGEGKGANWWCVLYPPLCFLDFSNGVAVGDGFEETASAMELEEEEEEVKDAEEDVDLKQAIKNIEAANKKEEAEMNEEEAVEAKQEDNRDKTAVEKKETKNDNKKEEAPVYTSEDEEPVKVKFFILEIWESIFQ